MTINRENTLKNIYDILEPLKNERLLILFKNNPNLFDDKELKQILDYLKTGNNSFLAKLLKSKIKEYEFIVKKMTLKQLGGLYDEENERNIEREEIEKLLK